MQVSFFNIRGLFCLQDIQSSLVPSFILFRRAIGALANISQVETMISSFLIPLQVCNFGTCCPSCIGFCAYWRVFCQALADKEGRIHCSLNLNTETGKLLYVYLVNGKCILS